MNIITSNFWDGLRPPCQGFATHWLGTPAVEYKYNLTFEVKCTILTI